MIRGILALLSVGWLAATALSAQSLRVAAWGSYEGVTGSADWSTAGAQLTLGTARGHAGWAAAEILGRFGASDFTARIGGLLHPGRRWWLSAEAGTATQPVFMPKNTWYADATALVAPRASLGIGYRRWNYAVGPVDIVIPHATLEASRTSWDLRLYLSRNPSRRTDTAFSLRATRSVSPRTAAWLLGGAGRESYLVGAVVRSLETVTGAGGIRYNAGSGLTLRVDASVVRSRPVLSRRGVALALERSF